MFEPGQVIDGKYRLLRQLGEGGMGAVFEAQHEMLGSRVAVKVIHGDLVRRPGLADRFLQEGRVAAQIRSPHVVQVVDIDRTPEGVAYMVMELLEGEPLSSVLERQHRLPVHVSCDYTRQILEGLEAAHAIGVTHRDLKPENVFVTFAAGRAVLKLIDFGIAKVRRTDLPPAAKGLTAAGVTMGTAEYMAPEQAYSADQADARSDLYAVGVMFYEMLAGVRPVRGDDARDVAMKVARGEVTPLVHAAPETPRELAGFAHRAMAARPEMRFASATEMRLALVSIVEGARAPGPVAGATGLEAPRPHTMLRAPSEAAFSPPPGAYGSPYGPPPGHAHAPRVGTGTPVGEEPPVRTERAPPVGGAFGYTPPPTGPGMYTGAPGRAGERSPARRRGSAAWLLLLIPLVLGAGAVAAFVFLDPLGTEPAPVSPATVAPTLTAPPPATIASPTPAPTAAEPVAPLVPSPNTRPTPATPTPRPPDSGKPVAADAGKPSGPTPGDPLQPPVFPPFPSGFPTSLPFPGVDGGVAIPPIFTIPSGFPTSFPLPFPPTAPTSADGG